MNEKLNAIIAEMLADEIETIKANTKIIHTYNSILNDVISKIETNNTIAYDVIKNADLKDVPNIKNSDEYKRLKAENNKLNAEKYLLNIQNSIALKNIQYSIDSVNRKIFIAVNQVYGGKACGKATFDKIRETVNSVLAETSFKVWLSKESFDDSILSVNITSNNPDIDKIKSYMNYYGAFVENKLCLPEKYKQYTSGSITDIAEISSKAAAMIQEYSVIAEKISEVNTCIKAFAEKFDKHFSEIRIDSLI